MPFRTYAFIIHKLHSKENTKSITDSNAILQEMTDKKDIQLPLITVVEEGYTKAVKYYMKQVR